MVAVSPKISSGASDETHSQRCIKITASKGHGEDIIVMELFHLNGAQRLGLVGPEERARPSPVACRLFGVDV